MSDVEVEKLKYENKEIVLIGTAHISKQSVELVEKTITEEKPDVIGVELDLARLQQLQSPKKWRQMNILEVIRGGKTYLLLLNLLLSNIQKKLGKQVGVLPGAEMKKAVDLAKKEKIPIVLLDRDVRVTLKRALAKMPFFEKLKLFWIVLLSFFGFGEELTAEKVEKLKQKDVMNQLMQELSKELPSVSNVLVNERDMFIANMILAVKAEKIVAVVGAGHLSGIKKYLNKKRNISELNTIPKKASVLRFLKFVVPLIFVLAIGWGFYFKGFETTLNILFYWIIINGSLSALGALIARAHWKSIITAFLASPLTSLHPALAAGWFAGLTEAKISMPQVKDFETLSELESYSDFNKNRVTKILLVTAFTNIGSTIGTILGFAFIATLL